MISFNPVAWFSNRLLSHVPPHFVRCNTPLTEENNLWILNNLVGRYAVVNGSNTEFNTLIVEMTKYPCFEDPVEAMTYELRWSGGK